MSGIDAGVRAELRAFVERVERLNEEKTALLDDIKEVFAEAKAAGFDTAAMRKVIKARTVDADNRREQLATFDLYMRALGLIDDDDGGGGEVVSLAAHRTKRKAEAAKKRKANRQADAGGEDPPPGGRKH